MVTVSLIDTTAKCDELIATFEEKKGDAEYRKEGITRAKARVLARKTKQDADLASVNAQILSLDTVITSLPDGDIKDNFVYEKTLEEHKLFRLQNANKVSLDDYFVREVEEASINQEIANCQQAIDDITAHKATL